MLHIDFPTEKEIRQTLLDRVARFCELTKTSKSALGMAIKRDKTLISDIADGRNFKIKTYSEIMDWLTANWPRT